MFIVTVINDGHTFYLRSTTWAFHIDRADKFETREAAQAAIEKAKKFWHTRIRKAAKIEELV